MPSVLDHPTTRGATFDRLMRELNRAKPGNREWAVAFARRVREATTLTPAQRAALEDTLSGYAKEAFGSTSRSR